MAIKMMNLNFLQLMILVWVLYAAAFTITAVRGITKLTRHKKFSAEDYLVFFGLACLTGLSVVITLMTPKFVATGHLMTQALTNPSIMARPESIAILDDNSAALKLMFSQMFLFFTTLFAAKLSLLFFFRRLIIGLPKYFKFWVISLIILLLLYLGCMASNLLTCTPLDKYWSTTGCSSANDRRKADKSIRFATGADISSDIIVMILPLNLLRKLQLTRGQKAGLAAVFGIGFIIIAFAIARLLEVTQATTNVTRDITTLANAPITLSAWSYVEASVSIMVVNLPTFRFLLSRATSRNYNGSSEPKRPSDLGPSLRTIGSGGQRKSKGSKTVTTTLGSVDEDDFGSSNELRDIDQSNMGDGITKQVGYVVSEQVFPGEPKFHQGEDHSASMDTDEYSMRLYPSHNLVLGDMEMESSNWSRSYAQAI